MHRVPFTSLIIALLFVFPIFSSLQAQPQSGVQQSGPKDIVDSIVRDLHREKKPSVMLNYVHWPSAFQGLSVAEKEGMNISSAKEMKLYFEEFFRDPGAFLKKELDAKLAAMPEDQRGSFKARFDRSVALMKEKQAQMRQKLASTRYQTGKVMRDGAKAKVELVTTLEGETRRELVPLVFVDGKWYLPSPTAMGKRVSTGGQ